MIADTSTTLSTGLKPYPKMKDSGVKWLGEVPEHWESGRAKVLFERKQRPVRPDDEIVTCFRDGTVTLRKNRRTEGFTNALKEIGYQGVRRGDLVIHVMDAFAGAIGVSDSDGKSTPVYSVCEPKDGVNSKFYASLVREMSRTGFIHALAKGIRERSTDFRYETFGGLRLPLPPPPEQKAIVRYLDYMDRRIQRYVRAKQKLIELLNEQKQAIIQRAVTRGINPDVKMKPSGVDWLGDIPEHWEVRRCKFTFKRIAGGGTPSSSNAEFWDGEIIWVTPSDISQHSTITSSKRKVTQEGLDNCSAELLPPNSLLVTCRAPVGNVALAEKVCSTNQGCKGLVPNANVINYIYAYNLFIILPKELQSLANGTTFQEISNAKLNNIRLPLPPRPEQSAIVEHIAKATADIETTISRAERQIALMREYRTRLVSDVVTGKLDVRNVDLPDDVDADHDDADIAVDNELASVKNCMKTDEMGFVGI